jgi:hypothetical protein
VIINEEIRKNDKGNGERGDNRLKGVRGSR